MLRKTLSGSRLVPVLMCLQVAPLLLLPGESWTLKTQEWWLPVLLTALVVVALVQLLIRHTRSQAPWYILSFAQGFSIISRLMMLLPHSTVTEKGVQRFDLPVRRARRPLHRSVVVLDLVLRSSGSAQPGLRLTRFSASYYGV